MPKNTLILDTEVYWNFFYLGLHRVEDGRRVGFEYSPRANFDRDKVRAILRRNLTVGFNSLNYDLPMIYLALSGASNEEIKRASDRIIKGGIRRWQIEEKLGIYVPRNIDHIDLFETNPSVKRGLKTINAAMHHKRLQELPYAESKHLTFEEMDRTIEYCQFGDIDGTKGLFHVMQEPIMLREKLAERYGVADLRSKSDAQVGETIIRREVERQLGRRVQKADVMPGDTFRYKVPEWLRFKTPYMQRVLEEIAQTDFEIGKSGKVEFPKTFSKFNIEFDGMGYTLGIGGLHSTEKNRAVFSDRNTILIDADVASQYPNIIMKLGLYPEALGPTFLPVYKSLIDTRLKAKREKDKATDKGLKISINGSYGKLGSQYSVLFAPHLMISVTLTGQLSLLMLIEAVSLAGIPVVSGNTDGVVFACPRDKFNGFVLKDGKPTDRLNPSPLQDIIDWWEGVSSFNLEFGEYQAIYSESVNTYIALKPGGAYKRKGDLANHWREKTPWGTKNTDYDPQREALKKSPQFTICSDAVLGYLLRGIPIEDTVLQCNDIREFITVAQVTGGATWRGDYLGKVVRFYWSVDGDPIYRVKPNAQGTHGKVPLSDGCQPAMLFDDEYTVPADLDRGRYIQNCYDMLYSIGARHRLPKIRRGKKTVWEKRMKEFLK